MFDQTIIGEIRELIAAIAPIVLPDPIDWTNFTGEEWHEFSQIDWNQFRLRLEQILSVYLQGIFPAGAIHQAFLVEDENT